MVKIGKKQVKIKDKIVNNNVGENDEKKCRICHDTDDYNDLINPCKCKGTGMYVHRKCLIQWVNYSKNENCIICREVYVIPKYFSDYFTNIKEYIKDIDPIDLAVVLGGLYIYETGTHILLKYLIECAGPNQHWILTMGWPNLVNFVVNVCMIPDIFCNNFRIERMKQELNMYGLLQNGIHDRDWLSRMTFLSESGMGYFIRRTFCQFLPLFSYYAYIGFNEHKEFLSNAIEFMNPKVNVILYGAGLIALMQYRRNKK